MVIFNKKAKSDDKTKKSLEIIKKEKTRIKDSKKKLKLEKKKIRQERYRKFFSTKLGKIIKKALFLNEKEEKPSLREQFFTALYYEFLGAIICLLILFVLSGGKNYFKLYRELNKLVDTYDTITNNYYGQIDKKELVDSATSSMVSSINDSFTNYTNQDDTNSFMENIKGKYKGIGATVATDKDNNNIFVEIFDDSPAKKAGLKVNDIILKINNKSFKNKTSSDIADYVKNSPTSKLNILVKRNNKEIKITIKREEIDIPTVTGKIIEQDNKKIGYINISIFTSITTKQFKKQLAKLEDKEIDGLIIDVRDNSGGYLSTVTDISSLFLKKGQIIYQLSSKSGVEKIKDNTKESRSYPIAVIINKNSASASEILASSIKESYKGHIIGVNSYGKGTVQKTKQLLDGSMIKFTIEKWLTPTGKWINKKGVKPTEYIEYDPTTGDNQLSKSVEIILGDLSK